MGYLVRYYETELEQFISHPPGDTQRQVGIQWGF